MEKEKPPVNQKLSGYFTNNGQLQKLVRGCITKFIDAHGETLTKQNCDSLARRIVADIRGIILKGKSLVADKSTIPPLIGKNRIFKIVREYAPTDYCQLSLDTGKLISEAQRDADVAWYDTHWSKGELEMVKHGTAFTRVMQDIAVTQARQEVAREIFEEMEKRYSYAGDCGAGIDCIISEEWQSFKLKYIGGQK